MIFDTTQVQIIGTPAKEWWDYVKEYSFVITLLVGTILGYGVQRFQEYRKFKKTRIYFFHSLFLLKESITNQINNYTNYINEFKQENDQVPDLLTDSGFNLNNINIVAKEDMFRIFILKQRDNIEYLNRFNFLMRSFGVLESMINTSDAQRKNISNGNNEALKDYNETRKMIRGIVQNLLDEYGKPKDDKVPVEMIKRIIQLNDEITKKRSESSYTIFKDEELYIKPLKVIVEEFHYVPLLEIISNISHIIYQTKKNREGIINKFTKELGMLKDINNKYVDILAMYKEYLSEDLQKTLN